MNNQPTFFGFAAEVGLTKHIGSLKATQVLIELYHIGKDSYVQDAAALPALSRIQEIRQRSEQRWGRPG